jgi:L-threonylcarbamoyladenylate synthase
VRGAPSRTIGLLTLQPIPTEIARHFARIEILSPTGDLREAAANFFAALRRLDAAGLSAIIACPFPETGLGRALNDRLRRAATKL